MTGMKEEGALSRMHKRAAVCKLMLERTTSSPTHSRCLPPVLAALLIRARAVHPELGALMRRLTTIYAITGGELPQAGKQKEDFNFKKSVLIAQLHNFEKVHQRRVMQRRPRLSANVFRLPFACVPLCALGLSPERKNGLATH
jgi:hypothetical protein